MIPRVWFCFYTLMPYLQKLFSYPDFGRDKFMSRSYASVYARNDDKGFSQIT